VNISGAQLDRCRFRALRALVDELPRFGLGGWARSADVREGALGGEYWAIAPAEASGDPIDPISPAVAGELASRGTIQSPNIRR
jgi:hypothetical protein